MDDNSTRLGTAPSTAPDDPSAAFDAAYRGPDPQALVDAGLPRVRHQQDYESLPEGSRYFSEDNLRRTKPYTIADDADLMRVPEGAKFIAPDGQIRTKPKYGDIGFTAQALHDMALTPEAKLNALKYSYGDKVKADEYGPYVQEDDGTIRRPGVRSLKSALGTAAAETLPAIGMVGGGLLGGGGGAVVGSGIPVAGTIAGGAAGATAGAVGGAMAGRQANNVILSLMGIHQPVIDQIASMGREGAYTAGGEVVGRGVGKVAQWAKGPSKEGHGLPNDFERGLPDAETPASKKAYASRTQQIAEDLAGTLESLGFYPDRGPFIGIKRQPKGSDELPNDYTMGLPGSYVPGTKGTDKSLSAGSTKPSGAFGSYAEPPAPKEYGYQMPGVRSFLGVNDEGLERLISGQKSGFKFGPSVAFPDAPMLTKIEQLDQMFNKEGGGRFRKSAREGYERIGQDILTDPQINAVVKEPLTSSTEAVSYKKAGEVAVQRAQIKMAAEDADLEARIAAGRQAAIDQSGTANQMRADLEQAYQSNMDTARNLVRSGVDQVRLDADAAMRDMTTRTGSSDLVNNIANSFRSLNSVVRSRASHYYNIWEEAAGGKPVDVTGLQHDAEQFFAAMPDGLTGKYPIEIRLLNRLAAPEGEEAITMTAGELHHLRSWMRHGIDYDDLMSDMSQGALKNFEGKVNKVIQGLPESDLLNNADSFYKDTIPYLNNEMIRATMRAIKGGTGIDPEVAANIFFKAGRAEDVREARKVLGPNLWNAVEAAHIQSLVNKSKGFDGVDMKKFSNAILADHQKGMLELGYSGPKAQELFQIAKDIQKVTEFSKGKLTIQANDTDSLSSILHKAQTAKVEADLAANADPLKAFDQAAKEMQAQALADRAHSPINTLFGEGMSYKGEQAAKNILSSEDKIIAAANYFGPNSYTFGELRKVFVRDFLQREFAELGQMRPELSKNPIMTDAVQQLMFPGWTRQGMNTLAKNLEFAFGAATVGRSSDVGASLAGSSRVFNPPNIIPGAGRIAKFPPIQFINRVILGKYYAALMEGVSHPAFSAWLTKSLASGNQAQRLAAKAVLNDRLKTSPWLGRAAGQYAASPSPDEPTQDRYAQ